MMAQTKIKTAFTDNVDEGDNPVILPIFRVPRNGDIDLMSNYFNMYPSRSCDFSVAGVMLWRDYFDYRISEYNDSLFIMGQLPGTDTHIFHAPVGMMDIQEYQETVARYCALHGIKGGVIVPHEVSAPEITDENESSSVMDGWREYLYDIHKFIGFPGKKMEKKRNHLHYFRNNYSDVKVSEISASDAADLIAFTIKFCSTHLDSELLLYEADNIVKILRDYDNYPYLGLVMRHNGVVIGYTFGEVINDTLFDHVEKGNIEYRGIYQALASELCEMALKRYSGLKYVNREDDMGSESLRQSKMSYHPDMYIVKNLRLNS